MTGQHRQRSRWVAAAASVLLVGAAWWLWSVDAEVPPVAGAHVATGATPSRAAPPPEVADEVPDKPGVVSHFEALNRYPTSTRRITADSFDLLNPDARHERRMPLDGRDGDWSALLTADRYAVRGDEDVTVSLELWHQGQPVIARDVEMRAVPADGSPEQVLDTERSGSAVLATFAPQDHWPELVGALPVQVRFAADGLDPREGEVDLFFTAEHRIPAVFTGQFDDEVVRGDLLVFVGVDVHTAGRFEIQANLYDTADQPFGWARFRGELDEGSQEVALSYAGLLFHDAGATGPYTLGQLRGRRLLRGEVPDHEDMLPWSGAEVRTAAYAPADFSAEVHDSPRRQRILAMYEDAVDRGVELTEPEYVGTTP